jgi:hypothetical protein
MILSVLRHRQDPLESTGIYFICIAKSSLIQVRVFATEFENRRIIPQYDDKTRYL